MKINTWLVLYNTCINIKTLVYTLMPCSTLFKYKCDKLFSLQCKNECDVALTNRCMQLNLLCCDFLTHFSICFSKRLFSHSTMYLLLKHKCLINNGRNWCIHHHMICDVELNKVQFCHKVLKVCQSNCPYIEFEIKWIKWVWIKLNSCFYVKIHKRTYANLGVSNLVLHFSHTFVVNLRCSALRWTAVEKKWYDR